MYLTTKMMKEAIKNMQRFNAEITALYEKNGMSLAENLGRRNNMLSQSQEHFIAQALRKAYSNVITDGAPGRPDIFIEDIATELECKLTTRNTAGSINLQIDYNTLSQKGSLDCLYLIASKDFNSFSALFFKGLTIDDFAPPASGSRGRARMIKWKSLKKCTTLVGGIENQKDINLKKISNQISHINNLISKNATLSKQVGKLAKLEKRKKYWLASPGRYKINLESV